MAVRHFGDSDLWWQKEPLLKIALGGKDVWLEFNEEKNTKTINDLAYSWSTRATKEPKCRQMLLLTDLWIRWRQVPAGPAGDFSDDGHHLLRESGHQGLILKLGWWTFVIFFNWSFPGLSLVFHFIFSTTFLQETLTWEWEMTSVVLFKTVSNILYLPTTSSVWQQKTFFYNQSHHLIYQYSTKLFFYFLTTFYCTWNYTFIRNCMEKTRLTWGSILRPPDNLIFGRLLFLHVIIFHQNFAWNVL